MKLILIDAGHGLASDGKTVDNGAQGIVSERKEVVEIALEAIKILRMQTWITNYIIEGIGIDKAMSLDQQVKEVNRLCLLHGVSAQDSILVSVHANKADSTASGVEVWWEGGNNLSRDLAGKLVQSMVDETKLPNRGIASDLTNRLGRLAIVRDVTATACLVECGFVDNPTDAAILKDVLKDDAFARGIVKGIALYLGTVFEPVFLDGVFTDVAKDRWSASYIRDAKALGLITGFPDGSFKPTQPMTREEVVALVMRARKV